MVVVGAGNSMLVTPLTGIALRRVTPDVAGAASGLLGTVLQCGSLAGSAAAGLLLERAVGLRPRLGVDLVLGPRAVVDLDAVGPAVGLDLEQPR